MRRAALFAIALAAGCGQPSGEPRQPIGSACRTDDACGSGPRFYCATDHPGGACEASCRSDGDCPAGAVCVGAGFLSKGDCHLGCDAASACRVAEGYRCITGPEARHGYCDPPGRSDVARRIRRRAWRW